jgi:hypothetical protein
VASSPAGVAGRRLLLGGRVDVMGAEAVLAAGEGGQHRVDYAKTREDQLITSEIHDYL